MNKDLKLNRMGKKGLVLEEYSHCEVPAGCGGVVIRWARSDAPAEVRFVIPGPDARIYVDGVEQGLEARIVLTPGTSPVGDRGRRPTPAARGRGVRSSKGRREVGRVQARRNLV